MRWKVYSEPYLNKVASKRPVYVYNDGSLDIKLDKNGNIEYEEYEKVVLTEGIVSNIEETLFITLSSGLTYSKFRVFQVGHGEIDLPDVKVILKNSTDRSYITFYTLMNYFDSVELPTNEVDWRPTETIPEDYSAF